jgi:hypothetical protein
MFAAMTRWVRAAAWRGRLARAVLASFVALGCGQVLGVDGYTTAPPAGDDASTGIGQARLPLPATPDKGFVDGCTTCVERKCTTERAACKASSRCMALLKDHSGCKDPNCVFRARDEHEPSPAFDDYMACAFGSVAAGSPAAQCAVECNAGLNLACTQSYRWDPAAGSATLEVSVSSIAVPRQVDPLSVFQGESVAPCSAVARAGTPAGDQGCAEGDFRRLDGSGHAVIRVGNGQDSLGSATLAVRGPWEHVRVYHRPVPRDGRLDLSLLPRLAFDATLPILAGYDPSSAILSVYSYDCLGVPAPRSTFKLGSDSPAVRFYWLAYGLPDATASAGVMGGYINVPESPSLGVLGYAGGGDVPTRATVITARGWVTHLDVYPASALNAM